MSKNKHSIHTFFIYTLHIKRGGRIINQTKENTKENDEGNYYKITYTITHTKQELHYLRIITFLIYHRLKLQKKIEYKYKKLCDQHIT